MSGDSYKITDQHATYYLTLTVVRWVDLFSRRDYKKVIVDSLNYCVDNKGLRINAWVIMSNHIHLIGRCEEPFTMSDFLRDFKKFTSKKFISTMDFINESRKDWLLDLFSFEARRTKRAEIYKIWQDKNHAKNTNLVDVWQKMDYIHDNPVRAGYVDRPEDYIYSSARSYAGKIGLVKMELL